MINNITMIFSLLTADTCIHTSWLADYSVLKYSIVSVVKISYNKNIKCLTMKEGTFMYRYQFCPLGSFVE